MPETDHIAAARAAAEAMERLAISVWGDDPEGCEAKQSAAAIRAVCDELEAALDRIAEIESRRKPINWPFVGKPKVSGTLDSDRVDLHGGEQP